MAWTPDLRPLSRARPGKGREMVDTRALPEKAAK